MKCVCGYEHERGLDNKGNLQENLVGDKPFKRIYINSRFTDIRDNEFYIYACPKCGTLKIGQYYR